MPNNGRITKCPYYRSEKNLSISCEDTFRRFRYPAQKKRHMDIFCDNDWKSCPYAAELTKLYEEMEKEVDMNKHKENAHRVRELEKELRKVNAMLGKSEKREKEKDAEIRVLRNKNRALENLYIKEREELNKHARKEEVLAKELSDMAALIEGRLCYMMNKFSRNKFSESDYRKWAKGKKFALIASKLEKAEGDEKEKRIAEWECFVEEDNGDESKPRGAAGKGKGAGSGKDKSAENKCEAKECDSPAEEA